jgi:hypothetical protein
MESKCTIDTIDAGIAHVGTDTLGRVSGGLITLLGLRWRRIASEMTISADIDYATLLALLQKEICLFLRSNFLPKVINWNDTFLDHKGKLLYWRDMFASTSSTKATPFRRHHLSFVC